MQTGSKSKTRILTAAALVVTAVLLGFITWKIKHKRHRSASSASVSPALSTNFKRKHFETGTLLFSVFNDLENVKERSISPEKSFSGIKSSKLSMSNEFGFAMAKKVKDIPNYESLKTVQLSFKCWMRSDMVSAQYVLSVEDKNGKVVTQISKPIVCPKKYDWNDLQFVYKVDPKWLDPENTIRLYAWNKELREFYVDDIRLSFYGGSAISTSAPADVASNYLYDFEKPDSVFLQQNKYIKEGKAHSGKMAFDLSGAEEYGPIVTKQLGEVGTVPAKRVNTSIWVYPLEENGSMDVVVSLFNAANEKYFLQTKKIDAKLLPKEQWTKVNATIGLPADGVSPDDVIQVLARNRGKTKLLLDDFEIVYASDNEAPGDASAMDPGTIYNKQFIAERNKPPFRTLYLQKQEIGNTNSPYLINTAANKSGDFTPGDDYLSGNFLKDAGGLDQVINIKPTEVGLYGYCVEKKQFTQTWKTTAAADLQVFGGATEKLVADFDNNQSDDVLLINKKAKTAQLLSFSATNACVPGSASPFYTLENKKENAFESWNMSADDVFMSGDFNGDHKPEVLIVNSKTGDWSLQQYAAKAWKMMAANAANNKLDPAYFNAKNSKRIAGKLLANKTNDVIFIAVTTGEKITYVSLEYNPARKQFDQKTIPAGDTQEVFFKNGNTTFISGFDGNPGTEMINLNTDWRFDLKLITLDAEGFSIRGNVDFKGYTNDYNPKYYEFVKIISGHFISASKTTLLVMMRNCADQNFSGTACKQYEDLNYLPNSTQAYQLEQ